MRSLAVLILLALTIGALAAPAWASVVSGAMWRFDPDALGRPQSARIGADNYVSSVDYHPNGLIADAAYLNGYSLEQTLNTRQLPLELKTVKSASPNAVWLSYLYDARRKIDLVTDLDGQGANEGRDYGYDANGRLLTATGPWGSGGAQTTGSFKYDALGNIREQKLGTRTIAINYTAATNRVLSAIDGGTTRNYSYDNRGNATGVAGQVFTYDFANQPTAVSGAAAATYAYDGNMKRVKEVRGGKTIYTLYSKVTGGLVYRDEDATGTANDIRIDYVNVGGAALRLKKTGTATVFVAEYTHFDSQGSAVTATSAAGAVTWRERYAPFGQELYNAAGNDNNTGYTGHLKDDATGLNYMQARYYDPILGRFLSTDPIGYQDQLNLYAYVHNDPVNQVDPDGEAAQVALAGLCVGPQAVGCLVVGAALVGACYLWCDDFGALILEARGRTPFHRCIECGTPGATETDRCPDCEVKKRREEGKDEKWWEDDAGGDKAKERNGGSPKDGSSGAQNASVDAEIDVAAAVGPLFSNESIVGVSINADGNVAAEISQTGSRIVKEVELNDQEY